LDTRIEPLGGDSPGEASAARGAVAYLVAYYPLISHTFILREVAAVRARGVRVETISVRRPRDNEVLSDDDRREYARTKFILDGNYRDILRNHLGLFLRRPHAYLSTLKEALQAGPRHLRSRIWQVFYFGEAVQLVHLMSRAQVRHVHVHFSNNAADIARLATHLGSHISPDRPWSWSLSVHGGPEFANVRSSDFVAKVQSASFVSCISDFCRSQIMAFVPTTQWSKLHVVHMGVDVKRNAAPSPGEAVRVDGPPRVLFVGRLVADKGVTLLVDVVEILRRRQRDLELVVVGTGPLGEQLREAVDQRGLSGSIKLVGALGQDDLPPWYAWADIFCLPSFSEGLPVVLMEAMLAEVPVVSTVIAGIPELVLNNDTGVLVPPGRPDLLADAIERLADDPDGRRRLAVAGRRMVEQNFDMLMGGAAMADLFEGRPLRGAGSLGWSDA
jgi:colanic acid/amylovoran biosynthesis glycosyltransferase